MKGAQNGTVRKSRSGIPAGDDVVFIGGIPRGATQSELREYFKGLVGAVAKVRFVIDHGTRHHKGYGFARFGSAEVASQVVALSQKGLLFKGKLLNVGPSSEERAVDTESSDGSETASASSGALSDSAMPPLETAPLLPTPIAFNSPATAPVIQQQPVLCVAATPQLPQQYVLVQPMQIQPQCQLVYVQTPCVF